MASNLALITIALRDLAVISEGETPSAEQGSHALAVLNPLMEALEVDGLSLGYFAQSDTTATCPIPAWAEKGIAAALAVDMAPTYGATVSAELAKKYDDGMATIKRAAINGALEGADMSHLPGGVWRWSIETDT